MTRVVLLAVGGGHTAYAYALAQHLSNKCEIESIVPEGDELSFNRLKKFGLVKTLIKPRGPKTPLGTFLVGLGKSLYNSSKLIKDKSVIVSTGSNFCIPPSLVAWKKGIPIVNIESSVRFTKASKTTKILARFATITALQWTEQKQFLPKGEVFGPLIAEPVIEPYDGGYILVTGGTYGHRLLFKAINTTDLDNVVLQAGALYSDVYAQKHPKWRVIDYSDSFHELIAGAEIVITHFGETVIDSALVYGKPTIISVNPDWTRTAKLEDAKLLAEKVHGFLLTDLSAKGLEDAVEKAKHLKPPTLKSGSEALGKCIRDLVNS